MGERSIPATMRGHIARAAVAKFQRDQVTDLAAALTYYAVFALFPGLLAVVSLLGLVGDGAETTQSVLDLLRDLGQADAAEQLEGPIRQMVETEAAGLAFVLGLAGALWSASGYVGAFGRAMNRIDEVEEGRPFVKLRATNLLITLVLVVLAALVLVGLVVSGPFARELGDRIGAGDTAVRIWNLGKLPVLLLIVVVIVALLYSATPNVRRRLRLMSTGAAIAIAVWVLASIGFGFYVANFSSYNATYGSLAGVIVFLLWLWLTNVALLFGAEVDAEIERLRELRAGMLAEEELQLPERDTHNVVKQRTKRADLVARHRQIRTDTIASERADAERAMTGSSSAVAASAPTGRASDGHTTHPVRPPTADSMPKVLAQAAGVGLLSAVVGVLAALLGVGDRR